MASRTPILLELGKRMSLAYNECINMIHDAGGDPKLVAMVLYYDGQPLSACVDPSHSKAFGEKLGLDTPSEVHRIASVHTNEQGEVDDLILKQVDEMEVEETYGPKRDPNERGN